jgi:phosphatidylinositol alpha-1,6-mannosyltransferase
MTTALQKKNILLIASEFPPNAGGIGNHAYNLALQLAKENYNVTVAADIIEVDEKELSSFKKNLPFDFVEIKRNKILSLTYFSRVAKSIAAAKKNDVIICSGKFSLWSVNWLKLFYPAKKYIAVVHGSELDLKNESAKKMVDRSLKKFDKIIAVSHYTKDFLPKNILQKIPVSVIANGINMEEFISFQKNKIENIFPENELSLITIGSATERKGQENVINALPAMLQIFPNIHYHIVGKPVIQKQLETLAKRLNVLNKITFHGMVEREKLLQLLFHSKIKLMLSNHTSEGDFEGFGIAILEANAFAKPSIGADFGGITDAIENNKTGILVDVKNATAIAKALKEIIENYADYSANALQWAQQHDWKIIVKKYIEVIEN